MLALGEGEYICGNAWAGLFSSVRSDKAKGEMIMVGRMTRALSIVLVVCLIVPPSYARSTAVASGGDREVIVQRATLGRAGRQVPGALSGSREAPSVDAGPRDVVRPLDFLTADQISVTENGFEPETLTVTAGSPVTWTNTTPQTHILVSGVPWRIYLPLVLRQAASQARSIAGLGPETSTFIHNTVLFTATLPPSGSFRYTFVTTGTYPYYLSTAPPIHRAGRCASPSVTVRPKRRGPAAGRDGGDDDDLSDRFSLQW